MWVVLTNATAVTGRLGTIKLHKEDFIVCHDHQVHKRTPLRFNHDHDSGLLVSEDGTINGLTNAKRMIKLGMLQAATQINIFVLTPLIEKSFNYCLLTHSVGATFNGEVLDKVYSQITSLAKNVDINIVSLAGDGDQRLRSFQWRQNIFPIRYQWLTKEEFPLVIGFNDRGQIAMQDVLHNMKKMRNNQKYLSTRIILFADPKDLLFEERFTLLGCCNPHVQHK